VEIIFLAMYYYQSQRSSKIKKEKNVNYVTEKQLTLNKKPKAIVKILKQRVN